MKRLQITIATITILLTLSTAAFAGTITGSRTNRVGTITGSRTGTITGSKAGTITGSKSGTITGSKTSSEASEQGMPEQLIAKLAMLMMSLAW